MAKSRSTAKKRKAVAAAPSAAIAPSVGEDPDAFIRHVREEKTAELEMSVGRRRQQSSSDDLRTLTRLVGALISTNEEIWLRCKESLYTDENDESDRKYMFARISIETIQVSSTHKRTLNFTTQPVIEHRRTLDTDLPQIKDVPEKLTSIFAVSTREENVNMPDYEKLFHSMLLLEEDVLLPFLNIFKDHLEDVQVRFGKVEAWLAKSEPCSALIKDLFPEFELPQTDPSEVCCENCGEYLIDHPNTYCTRIELECSTLKSIQNSDCGHDEKFNITEEKGRTKLKKFLEYIS